MTIHYQGHGVTLHHGDCLDVLRTLPDASVDSVVTDPPYGLEFMGKDWDAPWKASSVGRGVRVESERAAEMTERGKGHSTPGGPFLAARVDSIRVAGKPFQDWCEAWAAECLRVLKPGGHLLAFGGTRTWHRLACAVEDAGFEVRDSIAWMYGSGFPKSLDVSKAIDKAAGVLEHEGRGFTVAGRTDKNLPNPVVKGYVPPAPATPDAERWQGWGTALKPAFEPVVVARKPLIGTVAANVLEHGTGALNVDGCRIEGVKPDTTRGASVNASSMAAPLGGQGRIIDDGRGRWPANVVLDESHEPVLRLRYNLPTEVERTIRESFGASTDHLPAVRDTRDGAAEQGQASEVLLPQVPGALDVGEPDGRARPEVGQAAHAGDSGADLGDQEGQPSHGREGRELEGRALPQSGVRLREVVDAPAERAGDLRADGDPQRRDLHTGAPASRGAATRAGADLRGDRAPRERTQGGQPAGEPGTPRVEQLAPDEARRGRRRDVPAATGERTTPGSPLEVLRRECPPGWWRHFDVIGHRREGQAAALDEQSGELSSGKGPIRTREMTSKGYKGGGLGQRKAEDHDFNGELSPNYGDTGGASRFFYVAKADATERPRVNGTAHPTVKPLSLMRWLVRLVTPPGGTVLEPFAGSGTTVEACIVEGFDCIAIEKGDEYLPLIMQRIHRRRDPVAAIRQTGDELGLFELDGEGA